MAQDKDDPGTLDMFKQFKFESGGSIRNGEVEIFEPEIVADEVETINRINTVPKVEVINNTLFESNLVVNGQTLFIGGSNEFLSAVKFALEHPDTWYPTEAYEVADSIRDYLAKEI